MKTPPPRGEGLRTPTPALSPPSFPGKGAGGLGLAWFVAVAVICWQPFAVADMVAPFDWAPGLPREGKSDLYALEEMLTKLAVFAPFGVLAAAVARRRRVLIGAAVGLAVAAVFEAGQTVFPPHVPGITDVILGGFGAGIGAWAADRVKSAGTGNFGPDVY